MDPNNNQPVGANPIQQPVAPQPAATLPPVQPDAPKKGMGKGIILLVILLLFVFGMAAYILFAKNQMNSNQKTTGDNNSSVLPSPTATTVPTPNPENDLEAASPEADLIDIEADVKGL